MTEVNQKEENTINKPLAEEVSEDRIEFVTLQKKPNSDGVLDYVARVFKCNGDKN